MRQRSLWALAAAALLLASCGPGGQGPFEVVVLVYNSETGTYEPRQVTLTTPTDIARLEGKAARLVGGAKFVDNGDLTIDLSAEAALQHITKNPGGPVNASYIESQGALVPADFHSLNMATTYFNFERARDFFVNKLGGTLNETRFGVPNVYYFAEYVERGELVSDNAMFMALARGFFIMPFQTLQQVPMAINQGIVGHEYGHAVFNYLVDGSVPFPRPYNDWANGLLLGATPGANLIASLQEGAADVFGVGTTCSDDLVTCDTAFMGSSLPAEFLDARRVDRAHCMDETLWSNLETTGYGDFTDFRVSCKPFGCHYVIGSVFASAMWAAGRDAAAVEKLGQTGARKQMFQALWNAEGGANGATSWGDLLDLATDQRYFSLKVQPGSQLQTVLDSVIEGAEDPTMKDALCGAFMDRFGLPRSQFKRCPPTAQPMRDCVR
jgi:hypothetical protein